MPGLTIEERKRKAERPPEIEEEAPKGKHRKPRKFDEIYQALVVYKQEHLNCSVPLRYSKDRGLGLWVIKTRNTNGVILTPDQKERLTALGFDWETRQEKDERRWNEMFQKLKAYRRDYGDCCVPQGWAKDQQLARWVNKQRTKETNNKLTDHHKKKLDSIGFTWRQRTFVRDTSTEDKKWLQHYRNLEEFHKQCGHCIVPTNYSQDVSLGNWTGKQRQAFQEGKLSDERKFLLDELGFVWKIDKADANASHTQAVWEEMFQRLVEFKNKYGHVQVNRKFTKWGLGPWVSKQRAEGRKGRLDSRRAKRLQHIGIEWGEDWDQRWEEGFKLLKRFKKKHGHCEIPMTAFRNSRGTLKRKLGNWVKNQRQFNEAGTLLAERKERLDKIGFIWKGDIGQAHTIDDESENESDNSLSDNALNAEPEPTGNGVSDNTESKSYKPLPTRDPPSASAVLRNNEESDSDSEFEFEGDGLIVGLPHNKDTNAAAAAKQSDSLQTRPTPTNRNDNVTPVIEVSRSDNRKVNGTRTSMLKTPPRCYVKYDIGTCFLKDFGDAGKFQGKIVSFDGYHYRVHYEEDGDEEDLSEHEMDDLDVLD